MIHRDELSHWRAAAAAAMEREERMGRLPDLEAVIQSERGALVNEGKTLRDECPRIWAMLLAMSRPSLQGELIYPEGRRLDAGEFGVALLAQAGLAQYLTGLPDLVIDKGESDG